MSLHDRSSHYDSAIPQQWGPGPWDDDFTSWPETFRRGSTIRAWSPGDPTSVARQPLYVRYMKGDE